MKVIFINRFFYPDVSATSQMLSDQVFALAEQGREVVVITSRHGYSDSDEHYPSFEKIGNVTVHRVWTSNFGRLKLIGRTLDYASFLVSSSWRLLALLRPGDIVVAKTDPPLLSALAYPISALRGAKLVNWLQDLFPEAATALKVGRSRAVKWAFAVLRIMRNRSLRRARANVVIGDQMARQVEKLGVAPERIVTIPNWANGQLVHPIPHEANALRRQWNLQNAFVVVYSGNLGLAHDYLTFLRAIAIVERAQAENVADRRESPKTDQLRGALAVSNSRVENLQFKPVRWLFIGGGANYEKLQQEVAKQELKSVQFRSYQQHHRLAESLSCANIHLATLRPEMEGLSVPSKVYGSLASGRPVVFVGDRNGEIAVLLERYDCGIVIDQGDSEGLARVLLELAADPARTRDIGGKSRKILDEHFELRHAVAQWQCLLDKVAAEP